MTALLTFTHEKLRQRYTNNTYFLIVFRYIIIIFFFLMQIDLFRYTVVGFLNVLNHNHHEYLRQIFFHLSIYVWYVETFFLFSILNKILLHNIIRILFH